MSDVLTSIGFVTISSVRKTIASDCVFVCDAVEQDCFF
mgnify:CR=1 FL=1